MIGSKAALGVAGLVLAGLAFSPRASAQPSFTQSYEPAIIGSGGLSTLRYALDNPAPTDPLAGVTFDHDLPAGLTVAAAAAAGTDCVNGWVEATPGGDRISLHNARLGVAGSCSIWVNVTASAVGDYASTTSALSWSGGSGPGADGTLSVSGTRPGVSLSFDPGSVAFGNATTMTISASQPAAGGNVFNLTLNGSLPSGMVIAQPARASSDCGVSTFAPAPGSDSFSFNGFGLLSAGASCTIQLDVEAREAGRFDVVLGELITGGSASSGKPGAPLEVEFDELNKSFVGDPAPSGSSVDIVYTLTNFNRLQSVSDIAFTDDLGAALPGLLASTALPLTDVCGAGSSLAGTSTLSFSGGALGPGESCTFEVSVAIPVAAASGSYESVTSEVSYTGGSASRSWPAASDTLVVSQRPEFEKNFLEPVVAPGGEATLQYEITNTSDVTSLTDIQFIEYLSDLLPGTTPVTLPTTGFCGVGSSIMFATLGLDGSRLTVAGANLAPGESCIFDVVLQIPTGSPGGALESRSSYLTGSLGADTVVAEPPPATLTLAHAPRLQKSFAEGVQPGGSTEVEYTLSLAELAPEGVDDIAFSDDLGAVAAGLTFTGLPLDDVCGAGSLLEAPAGGGELVLTGASLSPGESCTFGASVAAAAGTEAGSYTSTTSEATATSQGLTVTTPGASAQLNVLGLVLTLSVPDEPAYPGGMATLQLLLDNSSQSIDASGINLSVNLSAALPGLTASALPSEPCGASSSLTGTTTLSLAGGTLRADESCTFSVQLVVPGDAATETYPLSSSLVAASWDGAPLTFPSASTRLHVADPLLFGKEFVDDPVAPGSPVTLRFTLANADPDDPASGLAFEDDLDAVLPGMVATGLPRADVCGAGSLLSGDSVIALTGGSLAADSMCTIDVEVSIPASATYVPDLQNVTTSLEAQIDGVAVSAPAARAGLEVRFVALSAAFDGATGPGGLAVLRLSIENLDTTAAMSNLTLQADLQSMLAGTEALDLPRQNVCGSGSELRGGDTLALRGGDLGPGESCSISVTVRVPDDASVQAYTLMTGALSDGATEVAPAATATLQVEPTPGFSMTFDVPSVTTSEPVRLSYAIDHSGSSFEVEDLAFSQTLPEGLQVAEAPQATSDCGGSLDAVADADSFSFSGGSLAAAGSCSVSVDVTSSSAGDYEVISSSLTSSYGESPAASASVSFVAPPEADAGTDAGEADAAVDGGAPDAGEDAGGPDAMVDAGAPDAAVDAGAPGEDAAVSLDAGSDAGRDAEQDGDASELMVRGGGGCQCDAAGGSRAAAPWFLLLFFYLTRRRLRGALG